MTVSAPQRAPARRRERCPSCDLPAQRGQLICLGCGTRLALDRGGSDKRAVAIAGGAMALVATISLLLIVDSLSGDGERPDAAAAVRDQPRRAAATAEAREQPVSAQRALWQYKAKARRQLASSAGTWPAGQEGWTVVLSTMYDEATAQDFAKGVEDSGVDAGVLSTEDYPALGTGVWYVFAGVYADEIEAGEAAAELAAGYPGAFTQYVQ